MIDLKAEVAISGCKEMGTGDVVPRNDLLGLTQLDYDARYTAE